MTNNDIPLCDTFLSLTLFMLPGIDHCLQLLVDRELIRSFTPTVAILCSNLNLYCYIFPPSWTPLVSQAYQSALIYFLCVSLAVKLLAPHCLKICDRITLAARQLYSVCFGLFQLCTSLTTLCYVGNWAKRLHFRMLKLRGSSDLISIVNVHKKHWPGKVYRNTSMARYWGGFWFLQNRIDPEPDSVFQMCFMLSCWMRVKGWE